ncbi:MAG: M20/M25/M40 family metallo-hydrolase [Maritimibacter sp.]|uniref:M20/M25/M40 family metallo-hydrolase n=1 Tax=Maritimibacter sp. TaxID=2003363 RepID=UPI001D9D50A5|nr:M20/M25/M40 family metallo-hydrolase [Maritimibacter sp.]MBL6426575.1 M20/M25/M40 family metallo-hydrolase [Maritimibacter sp.]
MGLARLVGRNRPRRGRVIALFQPAEEDGSGAAKVIEDPRFSGIRPDFAFALHNFPGLPLGHAAVAPGLVNCASRGMRVRLTGKTSHASQPENGTSPTLALSSLIAALSALSTERNIPTDDFRLVTVTHARLGEPAFGIAPGYAEIWATLRTSTDLQMEELVDIAEREVTSAASAAGLVQAIEYHDQFRHCENDPEATELIVAALREQGVLSGDVSFPMRGSEDFGRFGDGAKSAMFLLGSGIDSPKLHNPDFDFPDDLIEIGARCFASILRGLNY